MSLWQVINSGGFTLYILFACSILSLAVIMERCVFFWRRSRVERADFMEKLKAVMERGNVKKALELSDSADTPFASVAHAGLSFYGHSENEISNNMERQIVIETTILERFTAIVGTIGSVAVYIGLFGTVLGIIRAFQDISSSGAGGINVVTAGISEALVSTAAGLCVAIPAVVAYNYFVKRIDNFVRDMELCASETMDLVTGKQK